VVGEIAVTVSSTLEVADLAKRKSPLSGVPVSLPDALRAGVDRHFPQIDRQNHEGQSYSLDCQRTRCGFVVRLLNGAPQRIRLLRPQACSA